MTILPTAIRRAVMADELGPPDAYRLVDHDPGPPSPTQVRISVRAAGISFVDVLTAAGGYQVKPPVPYIPGSECAGVVDATGDEVRDFAVGDRVVGSGWGGMFANAVNLPARTIRSMPPALSFEEAAVFPVSYATAWRSSTAGGSRRARRSSSSARGALPAMRQCRSANI